MEEQEEQENVAVFLTEDEGGKSIEERLKNIFDAADEENEGQLSHKEARRGIHRNGRRCLNMAGF